MLLKKLQKKNEFFKHRQIYIIQMSEHCCQLFSKISTELLYKTFRIFFI